MSDETNCPSCQTIKITGRCFCHLCGRVFQDTINLTLEKGHTIGIRKWKFNDKEDKEHEVIALRWNDRILHFGEDGLCTNLFKDTTP